MTTQPTPAKPPQPGDLMTLAPGVASVLAPNPSPMTYWGTNTFLLGDREVCVIDPGPVSPAHLDALTDAIAGRPVRAILVTHNHRDHSPLCAPLQATTGAPIVAFGTHLAGRSVAMQRLAAEGLSGGGEGVDETFAPDETLADKARLELEGHSLEAIWTPGHMANHLSFSYAGELFCGDIVMGWASTLISPPDGDLAAFYRSCDLLLKRPEARFHPAHGSVVETPKDRIRDLVAHRKTREAQVLTALTQGAGTAADLTEKIYADVDRQLWPAATRNVLAHLLDLEARGHVEAQPALTSDAVFKRID